MSELPRGFEVKEIDHTSGYINDVFALWRTHSNKLGELPREEDRKRYVSKRFLLVAIHQNKCIGFLMFSIKDNQARLLHLCIKRKFRKQGIATSLVERLKKRTRILYCIKLACRRDYGLDSFWSHHGFVPKFDKQGRNQLGIPVTNWELKHGHPDLISILNEKTIGNKIPVAIDTNIFIDLCRLQDSQRNSEDSGLLASSEILSEVELCLTSEIFTDLNRINDKRQREEFRSKAQNFLILNEDSLVFDNTYKALQEILPIPKDEQDASDIRHLARAISSNVQIFITRDQGILDINERNIYEKLKISILRPSDLILHLDEVRRELDYHPVCLGSTKLNLQLVKPGIQKKLIDSFINNRSGEKRSRFKEKLQKFLTNPDQYNCFTVGEDSDTPLAFLVYSLEDKIRLNISFLRINERCNFSATLIRLLLLHVIRIASQENRVIVQISDMNLPDLTIKAMLDDRFIFLESEQIYLKFLIKGAYSSQKVADKLRKIAGQITGESQEIPLQFANLIDGNVLTHSSEISFDIEKDLYPLKIINAPIVNYILSIKPSWAEQLFDEDLAKQLLFLKQDLALKRELIYYRSAKNSINLISPARILWYVSKGDSKRYRTSGTMSIRACSRLDDITIDTPKEIYKKFRRLGVYSFDNVKKTAGDLTQSVMAIKFSDTEMFPSPVPLDRIHQVLNCKAPLLQPYKITPQQFEILYNEEYT
ncbi:MAG: GNAT family N-acetyltransferase [Cyanobacteria bacterium P01_F01_bin.150]